MSNIFKFPILLVYMAGILLYANETFAQNTKVEEVEITVLGNCGMCKDRIEKAAYSVRGVRKAVWDKDEKKLALSFRSDRTDQHSVERAIAKAGHDTQNFLADEETHAKLHTCCVYQRDAEFLKKNKLWNQE